MPTLRPARPPQTWRTRETALREALARRRLLGELIWDGDGLALSLPRGPERERAEAMLATWRREHQTLLLVRDKIEEDGA